MVPAALRILVCAGFVSACADIEFVAPAGEAGEAQGPSVAGQIELTEAEELSADISIHVRQGLDDDGALLPLTDLRVVVGDAVLLPTQNVPGGHDYRITLARAPLADPSLVPVAFPGIGGRELAIPTRTRRGGQTIDVVRGSTIALETAGGAEPPAGPAQWSLLIGAACDGRGTQIRAVGLPPQTLELPWELVGPERHDFYFACLTVQTVGTANDDELRASISVRKLIEWTIRVVEAGEPPGR